MGEFHDAVSVLLDAFARGMEIIKARRTQQRRPSRENEARLSKALKKHRTDVKKAYSRDQARFGRRFATGDTEARSSLSAILFRLNAGFVSIIESFARGGSSTDYQALLNLSNSSRMEAIHTFEQLSKRLSQSSSATPQTRKRHANHSRLRATSKAKKEHQRSRKTPELSFTPLGLATPEGWVRRPKQRRKLSLDSKSAVSPLRNAPAKVTLQIAQRASIPEPKPGDRKSIMSFASDSTKLGEIPERKWTRPPVFESRAANFPISTFYPLEPYREPEKPRSRFMRLFKR